MAGITITQLIKLRADLTYFDGKLNDPAIHEVVVLLQAKIEALLTRITKA